jgi:hypothetical protein
MGTSATVLVATSDFGIYRRGDTITNSAAIAAIMSSGQRLRVIRVSSRSVSTTAPVAAKGTSSAPAAAPAAAQYRAE